MATSLGSVYLETVIKRLKYYKQLADKTFEQLNDSELHYSPNEASNSIAVIVQHMSGNMISRWTDFLTSDGEKEWRDRDGEFDLHNYSKKQILDLWENGWNCMFDTLNSLKEDDLLKTVHIRKDPLLVVDAINRQLAHYPYHVGQIIFAGKLIKNDQWKNLSIPKGKSEEYNKSDGLKDPANLK
jgi:hypothetical protein